MTKRDGRFTYNVMVKTVFVQALPNHRIFIRFGDGDEGEVDLSEFAGKGVFSAWDDASLFEQVHIGEHRQICWNDDIELCPDTIYMKLTGKTLQQYFAMPDSQPAHA